MSENHDPGAPHATGVAGSLIPRGFKSVLKVLVSARCRPDLTSRERESMTQPPAGASYKKLLGKPLKTILDNSGCPATTTAERVQV